MNRAWHVVVAHGLDLLIVVAAGIAVLDVVALSGRGAPTGLRLWLEALAVASVVLALLARRRFPFGAPAATWLASGALSFVDGRLIAENDIVFVAGLGAAVLLGHLRNDLEARVGLAMVLGGAATVVYNSPSITDAGSLVFTPLLFGLGWLVGFALRARTEQTEAAEERAARAERERETAARLAVAEERSRIARELHDVVAHAVSVMVLQVGAVRHRMAETDSGDGEALRAVEEAGRTALREMPRLLNAMRSEGDTLELLPHPGLDDLSGLLTDVRSAGLPVELRVHGPAYPLPPGLDLSAYRILQEGLTNALKHARAQHATVDLGYEPSGLRLEVRDDGQGQASANGSPGHGLVGIRERVKLYGGEMTAGPAPEGGFRLQVVLPLEGDGS